MLDKLKIQQRLKYFGFPGEDGLPLLVNGVEVAYTEYATRLFNAAVRGTTPAQPDNADDAQFSNSVDRRFINSSAAPRWINLSKVPGVTFAAPTVTSFLGIADDADNPEVWGTNWIGDLLGTVTDTVLIQELPPLPILYASLPIGGERVDRSNGIEMFSVTEEGQAREGLVFDAGLDVAFDLATFEFQAQSFFKTLAYRRELFRCSQDRRGSCRRLTRAGHGEGAVAHRRQQVHSDDRGGQSHLACQVGPSPGGRA